MIHLASKTTIGIFLIFLFILEFIYHQILLAPDYYAFISWTHRQNSSLVFDKWRLDSRSNVNISFAYLHSTCNCSEFKLPYVQIKRFDENNNNTRFTITVINPASKKESNVVFSSVGFNELNSHTLGCDLYNVLKRGQHQKIISYSLYGKNRRYYINLERILETIPVMYKGYFVRIYYDHTINQTLRCELECKYSSVVDFCNINRFVSNLTSQLVSEQVESKNLTYMNKMMWRFLPIGDTFVDVFMSRDLDSIFIQREIDSVNVWMNSSSYGHIMRGKINFYLLILLY